MKIWSEIVSDGKKYKKMSGFKQQAQKESTKFPVNLMSNSEFRTYSPGVIKIFETWAIFVLHFWTWDVIFWNLATIVVYNSTWTFLEEKKYSIRQLSSYLAVDNFLRSGKCMSNVKLKYQDPSLFLMHIYEIVKYLMTKEYLW